MTNQGKGYPFEVPYPDEGTEVSGGVVLTDQVKSLSWEARNAEFLGRATDDVMAHTIAKLRALIIDC